MTTNPYDKGFGRSPRAGQTPRGDGQERTPQVHRVLTPPRDPTTQHVAFGEHASIPADAPPAAPRRRIPWADHAGRVGGVCAGVGFVAGVASLIAWGNWAAPLVLPVLLGLSGFIVFWLAAKVLDTVRGV